MNSKIKIAFLVSGGGGNMKFIHRVIEKYNLPLELCLVLADRECDAITYANNQGIASAILNYDRNNSIEFDKVLQNTNCDLVVTNIHKILSKQTLAINSRFINLHYSLLPDYAGLIGMKTIVEAKRDGKNKVGVTVHEVNEILDGGKIINQLSIETDWNQPLEVIYNRIFQLGAKCLLKSICELFMLGTPQINSANPIWEDIKS